MLLYYILLLLSLPLACPRAQISPTSTTPPLLPTRVTSQMPPKNTPRVWDICFDELGCINTTNEWYHKTYRERNCMPLSRRVIDTRFLLHTKKGSKDGDILPLTPVGLQISGFDYKLPTSILIHDFHTNAYTGWIRTMSEALLNTGARNIIAVNWAMGALPPYVQAVANARVVALEVKNLLRVSQVNVSRVHLIGHGLGAHIAGYVGSSVPNLGRITGLDPSGPQFQGMPAVVSLDANDALFVDVIHTDASPAKNPNKNVAQGTSDTSGHVDFFPNGGGDQPGCKNRCMRPLMEVSSELVPVGKPISGCSHKRAFKYFIESIQNTNCTFMALECATEKQFKSGNCSHCVSHGIKKCAAMGLATPLYHQRANVGKYFFKTADSAPYCLFGYRIEMEMDTNTKAKKKVQGDLTVSILGAQGSPISIHIGSKERIYHGVSFSKLGWHGQPVVDTTTRAQVDWNSYCSAGCINCKGALFISKIQVTALPRNPSLEEVTVSLCSCDGQPFAEVPARGVHVFVPCSMACTMANEVRQKLYTGTSPKRGAFRKVTAMLREEKQHLTRSTFMCEINNGEISCATQQIIPSELCTQSSPTYEDRIVTPPLDEDEVSFRRSSKNSSYIHF